MNVVKIWNVSSKALSFNLHGTNTIINPNATIDADGKVYDLDNNVVEDQLGILVHTGRLDVYPTNGLVSVQHIASPIFNKDIPAQGHIVLDDVDLHLVNAMPELYSEYKALKTLIHQELQIANITNRLMLTLRNCEGRFGTSHLASTASHAVRVHEWVNSHILTNPDNVLEAYQDPDQFLENLLHLK